MHIWDEEAFFNKATYFYQQSQIDQTSGEFPLWCSLSLEVLARASLSHISPVLNADPQNEGQSILFALGLPYRGQPRSIPVHSVLARLEQLDSKFAENSCKKFCEYFATLRNEELHTGGSPFASLATSKWLPGFYLTAKVLCESMGKTLEDFIGKDAKKAEELIDESKKNVLSAVKSRIANHKAVFDGHTEEKRLELSKEAERDSDKWDANGDSILCPACGSQGVVHGYMINESEPKLDDDFFYSIQTYRANKFMCKACNLSLNGTSEIIAAELEITFTKSYELDLHDHFQLESYDDYMNM